LNLEKRDGSRASVEDVEHTDDVEALTNGHGSYRVGVIRAAGQTGQKQQKSMTKLLLFCALLALVNSKRTEETKQQTSWKNTNLNFLSCRRLIICFETSVQTTSSKRGAKEATERAQKRDKTKTTLKTAKDGQSTDQETKTNQHLKRINITKNRTKPFKRQVALE